jgi:hypothetical protein
MKVFHQSARWMAAAAIALAATTSGCFGRIPVHPVKGTITFDGKPMKGGGSIAFVPLGDQQGKTAGGEVLADGTYQLMTHQPGDGSMAGDFRVVITQVTQKEPERTPDGKAPPKGSLSLPEADRIPAIYADSQNSPLTAKVEAKSNEINFELKRK